MQSLRTKSTTALPASLQAPWTKRMTMSMSNLMSDDDEMVDSNEEKHMMLITQGGGRSSYNKSEPLTYCEKYEIAKQMIMANQNLPLDHLKRWEQPTDLSTTKMMRSHHEKGECNHNVKVPISPPPTLKKAWNYSNEEEGEEEEESQRHQNYQLLVGRQPPPPLPKTSFNMNNSCTTSAGNCNTLQDTFKDMSLNASKSFVAEQEDILKKIRQQQQQPQPNATFPTTTSNSSTRADEQVAQPLVSQPNDDPLSPPGRQGFQQSQQRSFFERPSAASCNNLDHRRTSNNLNSNTVATTAVDTPSTTNNINNHFKIVGQEKVFQAMDNGTAVVVKCLGCDKHMMAATEIKFVYCPGCGTLSPIDMSMMTESAIQNAVQCIRR